MDDRTRGQESESGSSEPVHVVCDRFEAAVRAGAAPDIRAYLEACPEAGRRDLLKGLILRERRLLAERGCRVGMELYRVRFSDYPDVLAELEADVTRLSDPSVSAVPDGDGLDYSESLSYSDSYSTWLGESETPKPIKDFQFVSILGRGGFGVVWRAVDTRLEREVAIKVSRRSALNDSQMAMLLREARAVAKLKHPNIVPVHEVGFGDKATPPYIVTALIDGQNLKEWTKGLPILPAKAARVTIQLAQALQHAHDAGIVHRDLKPANVLMDKAGVPYIVDFGLAKRTSDDDSLSIRGQIVGTPNYMSPEQAKADHKSIGARTDVYALGVILYELLTGKLPFQGDLRVLLEKIIEEKPTPPRAHISVIPEDLQKVCLKCLEKNPANRYPSAQAVADDLTRYLNGETLRGVPVVVTTRLKKWCWRQRRVLVALLALTVVWGVVGAGVWYWTQPPDDRQLVRIQTRPEGCTVTAIRLNDVTGDPDPTQITPARGKTPLFMRLRPGNYLIVAEYGTERFHEVLRHIPFPDEAPGLWYPHQFFSRNKDGYITLREIGIPRPSADITGQMAFLEGNSSWRPQGDVREATAGSLNMPAFYIDPQEVQVGTLKKGTGGLNADNRYGSAVVYLEEAGKRPPTRTELLYALEQAYRQRSLKPGDALYDAEAASLSGLFDPPYEWTSTPANSTSKAGSRFSLEDRNVIGGASLPLTQARGSQAGLNFRLGGERAIEDRSDIGVRGVRSARPRTKFEHFLK